MVSIMRLARSVVTDTGGSVVPTLTDLASTPRC